MGRESLEGQRARATAYTVTHELGSDLRIVRKKKKTAATTGHKQEAQKREMTSS